MNCNFKTVRASETEEDEPLQVVVVKFYKANTNVKQETPHAVYFPWRIVSISDSARHR